MSSHNPSVSESVPPAHAAKPDRGSFWQNIIAAGACMVWNLSYLVLSLRLPAGQSRGDAGPGSLPTVIAVFGIMMSAIYLFAILRGSDLGGSTSKIDLPRVAGLLGLFVAVAMSSSLIGLALGLAIGAGAATLLFPGEKPLMRALATGLGFWVISYGLFGKLLALPLP